MNNLEFRAWHKGISYIFSRPYLLAEYTVLSFLPENEKLNGIDRLGYDDFEFDCIEQYTGLKDKNGKKIYEGDIALVPWINEIGVCSEDDYIRQKVVYEQDGFLCKDVNSIKMAKDGDGGAYLTCFLDVDGQNCIEVIGNIHENPELLKGKEED